MNSFLRNNEQYYDRNNLIEIWKKYKNELTDSRLNHIDYQRYLKKSNRCKPYGKIKSQLIQFQTAATVDTDDSEDESEYMPKTRNTRSNVKLNFNSPSPTINSKQNNSQQNKSNTSRNVAIQNWQYIMYACMEAFYSCGGNVSLMNVCALVDRFIKIINVIYKYPIDFKRFKKCYIKVLIKPQPDKLHLELKEIVSFWEPYQPNIMDFEVTNSHMMRDEMNGRNTSVNFENYSVVSKYKHDMKVLYIIVNYSLLASLVDKYIFSTSPANASSDKFMHGSGYLRNIKATAQEMDYGESRVPNSKKYKNNVAFYILLIGCHHALGHLDLLKNVSDNSYYNNHTKYHQLTQFANIKYLTNLD
jgi:hypothetical protein